MEFDSNLLAQRAWAVPGLCGLLILHHDFEMPRSTNVTRIIWQDDAVEVHLQYANANRSGRSSLPTRLIATLYRNAAVGIRFGDQHSGDASTPMLSFLAGEIAREAEHFEDLRGDWNASVELDSDLTSVLSIASALAALPYVNAQIQVEKNLPRFGSIAHLRLNTTSRQISMTPSGNRGILFSQSALGEPLNAGKRIHKQDVRSPARVTTSPLSLSINSIARLLRTTLQLPLYFAVYLLDKIEYSQGRNAMGFVDYLPSSEVAFSADENLSGLSH